MWSSFSFKPFHSKDTFFNWKQTKKLSLIKNILCDWLQLKGTPSSEVDKEVEDMIKETGLLAKTNTQSQKLSGGQKRKLSVGIALISGSKVDY